MKALIKKVIRFILAKLVGPLHRMYEDMQLQDLPTFANLPKNVHIDLPRKIINADRIHMGDNVFLGPDCLIMALDMYPDPIMQSPEVVPDIQHFDPKIVIGNQVSCTARLILTSMSEVTIEDDVMMGSNINITNGFHGYENADVPYKYQRMFNIKPIVIKRGCWIGDNVVIMPGVTIGENCIIGANSVVTKDVCQKSIVFGAPAHTVKQWDENEKKWIDCRKA